MTESKEIVTQETKQISPKTIAGFTKSQVDLIKRTVAKGSSDDELKLFLHIANKTGLDPFARQIYAVKRWNSDIGGYVMTHQTGIDGYRLIAERTGKYAPGKDTTYTYSEDGKLESATAYIQKQVGDKWFEVSATARYDEYAQIKKDGTPNSMWGSKPHVMLAKCAEGLALRRAFPAELSGVYVEEEIGNPDHDSTPKETKIAEFMTPIELKYFHTQMSNFGVNHEIVKLEINKRFGIVSSKELTKTQAAEIIKWAESVQVGA